MIILFLLDKARDDHKFYLKTLITQVDALQYSRPFAAPLASTVL